MSLDFELVLEDCLARLRSGKSLENCLSSYPEQADELRLMLTAVVQVRAIPVPQARPEAVEAGRHRMFIALEQQNWIDNTAQAPVSNSGFSRYTVRIFTFLRTLLFGKETHGMKFALRLAIDLVVILMIGSVLTVNASARSLPGDPLYGVKRTWEEVRLTLTLVDPARQQLQDQIQQLRLEEIREMVQMGRAGIVEFEGQLESMAADEWLVSGIQVRMPPDTTVEGNPVVGQIVWVRARVQNDGALTALRVHVQIHWQQTAPYPMPMSSKTPMPTPAPSRTPWPTHEPTHMPWSTNAYPGNPMHTPWTDDHYYNPMHTPEHTDIPHGNMPGSTPWPNDDHLDGMPGSTPWPNDDHHDDNNHNNDNHYRDDGNHHNNSDGSSWSGGSGSHYSWP